MLALKSYAKINLGLRILRKREDGYHDIETVFHRVNIFDEIELSTWVGISLTCNNREVPANDNNLCVRAATLLGETYGVGEGVHIQLTKCIPIGAGLGGGSSDAASTLLGLNLFWNLNLGKEKLAPLALELGADVPYFLNEGSAYATGRGEKLEYLDVDVPHWILIVYPNIHISTAWAFKNAPIPNRQSPISLREILLDNLNEPRSFISLLPNDFEPLVLESHPVVALVKKLLYSLGAEFAQMTGSGSSVYGLFSTKESAINAMDELRKNYPVFLTHPHFRADKIPNLIPTPSGPNKKQTPKQQFRGW